MTTTRTREYLLGHVAGLELTATPMALAGSAFLVVFFAAIGHLVFGRGWGNAILGGVALMLLHWVSDATHNFAHSLAARRTGHRMAGISFGRLFVLATCTYPADEPELPAEVHIRRALGGPIASAVLSVLIGILVVATLGVPRAGWVPLVWFLDNTLTFAIGSWVPVGFNDVSTILYWRKRRA